jgi:cyclic pyranopterin phosphate synthase
MVDVSAKPVSFRQASVEGSVKISADCAEKLSANAISEVRQTARLAGIMASKLTSQLIPLCHPVPLTHCSVEIEFSSEDCRFKILATTKTNSQTGVEMEAFAAAQVAGLAIYDMIKGANPTAEIGPFRLKEKLGGTHSCLTIQA